MLYCCTIVPGSTSKHRFKTLTVNRLTYTKRNISKSNIGPFFTQSYHGYHIFYMEGSTSQEVMRDNQSCTAFQADRDGGSSLSEGILSFVEYAPRLLIVLPSRQF